MPQTDPYPNQEILSMSEVAHLVGMQYSTFRGFLRREGTGFPAPVSLGQTAGGRPILRWRKYEVLAWLDLLPRQTVLKRGKT